MNSIAPGQDIPAVFDGCDPLLQSAILQHSLGSFPWTLSDWQAPFFWPAPWSLAFNDPLFGQALLVGWIPGMHGQVAWAYNLCLWLTLALSFWMTAALARRLGLPAIFSAMAGWAYIASPYAAGHIQHLNQLPSPWLPLALLGVLHFRRSALLGAILILAAAGMQMLSGIYSTAVLLMSLVLVAVLRIDGPPRRRHATLLLVMAGIVAGLWLLARPYLLAAEQVEGFMRGAEDAGPVAARIFDFFHPPAAHLLKWPSALPMRPTVYPGWLWSLMGLGALLLRWRAGDLPEKRLWLGLALASLLAVVFSFGRTMPLPGLGEIPMPWAWAQDSIWPLKALRSSSRFFLVTSLLLALAGASAGAWAWSRASARPLGRILLLAGLLLALLEMAPGPTGSIRARPDDAEKDLIYHLKSLPQQTPWIALPVPCFEGEESGLDARTMLWSVLSGQPVAGGSSGFVPGEIRDLRARCCQGLDADCARTLLGMGIHRIVAGPSVEIPGDLVEKSWESGQWRLYLLKPSAR